MPQDLLLNHLARWMFGLSASFHFLFVPLSIGLLLCICLLQTAHAISRRPTLDKAAAFWGRYYLLAWATGVATGYPLRSQLAELWGPYLQTARAVFDAVFVIEGAILWPMVALVLALTLGRRWLHTVVLAAIAWVLLAVMAVQSLCILSINAWMQVPSMLPQSPASADTAWLVVEMQRLLLHPTTLHKAWHTLSAALLCGAFFLFAGSALWMRSRRHMSVARVSVGAATWVGLLAVVSVLASGHSSASGVSLHQPMKFAAFEAHWRAEPDGAPLVLWAEPDEHAGRNRLELSIPALMSLLRDGTLDSPPGVLDLRDHLASSDAAAEAARIAGPLLASSARDGVRATVEAFGGALGRSTETDGIRGDWIEPQQAGLQRLAEVQAQRLGARWDAMTPEQRAFATAEAARPPVKPVFLFFRVMVAAGLLCALLCTAAFIWRKRLREGRMPLLLGALLWFSPLPWIATLSGWAVAEIGRQPWAVYGHLPTAMAGGAASVERGLTQWLVLFAGGIVLSLLFAGLAMWIWRQGPESAAEAGPPRSGYWGMVQHPASTARSILHRLRGGRPHLARVGR